MAENPGTDSKARLTQLTIGHGLIVLFIGLIAGVMLVFSLLDAVALWPLPAWEVSVGGSTRGWQAAHVGGILNGVMIAGLVLVAGRLPLADRAFRHVAICLIATGWGNTLFYWAGNFAANRGLSAGDTPFGPGDVYGVMSYLGGGGAMFLTFYAVVLMIGAAFRKPA